MSGLAHLDEEDLEMEALAAVSVACLTIYDMPKAAARDMTIERIELLEKGGGANDGSHQPR